jgi:hypothetical protein
MLVLRDQACRTPYCDAPIRHADHIRPHRVGGPTSLANAAGLCERCNHAKEAPGWATRVETSADWSSAHRSVVMTPTGHPYPSEAPALVTTSAPRREREVPTREEVCRRCGIRQPLRVSARRFGSGPWSRILAEDG